MTELELRQQLAATYRMFAQLGMDDLTYTHLSARLPGGQHYFIYPLGLMFGEVTASSLLKITLDGQVLEGHEDQYNQTGYIIHSSIYKHRPDVNAIFHLHTTAGVAVSALKAGLLPTSQFSFHFYNRHSYYDYDSLALDAKRQGQQLAQALGDKHKALILRNHGTLCCGTTIQEAFFYSYYLEQACRVQCAALRTGLELVTPSPEVCEQAAQDMRNFEADLGQRDWQALLRQLEANSTDYKN